MEYFKRAKVFRLKSSHKDKYLVANGEDTVEQSRDRESTKGHWAFELVEGKTNVIRLRSCHTWKYLASLDKKFLTGLTGCKVAQRLRLDTTVEWLPIKEGPYVKFKSRAGTFLRANRGPPPWRNTVTTDTPDHWTGNENMVTWIVDIVRMADSRLENELTVANGIRVSSHHLVESQDDYNYDNEKKDNSESFSKLKSMLDALEDSE